MALTVKSAAGAQEVREPLLTLHPRNSQDSAQGQSTSLEKGSLSHQPQLKPALRSVFLEATTQSGPVESEPSVLPRSKKVGEGAATGTAPTAQQMAGVQPCEELSGADNRPEDRRECRTSSTISEIAEVDDGDESLLQLKLEAMTWAAMAKDHFISSLGKKYAAALKFAKAEQTKNKKLESLLRNSMERQEAMAQELEDAKEQINKLVEAEERLCTQLGNLEAEGVREDRRYRTQIATLTERIKAQDHFITHSLKTLKSGKPVQVFVKDQSIKLQSELSRAQDNEQSLVSKLDLALKEINVQRAALSDANTDLRVSEVLRRNQARRLKVLEKERRSLMRKGAIRSVRIAPHFHKRNETKASGGEGWKVFSILEFEG